MAEVAEVGWSGVVGVPGVPVGVGVAPAGRCVAAAGGWDASAADGAFVVEVARDAVDDEAARVVVEVVVEVVVVARVVDVVVATDAGGVPAGGFPLPKDQPSAEPAAGTYVDAPPVAYCQAPQVPSAVRVACQYDQYGVAMAHVEGAPSIRHT